MYWQVVKANFVILARETKDWITTFPDTTGMTSAVQLLGISSSIPSILYALLIFTPEVVFSICINYYGMRTSPDGPDFEDCCNSYSFIQ